MSHLSRLPRLIAAAYLAYYVLHLGVLAFREAPFPALAYMGIVLVALLGIAHARTWAWLRIALAKVYAPILIVIAYELARWPIIALSASAPQSADTMLALIVTAMAAAWFAWLYLWLFRGWQRLPSDAVAPLSPDERHYGRWRAAGLLALGLALLGYWGYVHFINWGPFYPSQYYWDAEPAYLVDGLAPFAQGAYEYVYHPDGPILAASTLLHGLMYPFITSFVPSFIEYQLAYPDAFTSLARLIQTAIAWAAVVYLSVTMLPRLQSAFQVLLAWIPIGLIFGLHRLSWYTPYTFIHHITTSYLALLWLTKLWAVLRAEPRPRDWWRLGVSAGLICAINFYAGGTALALLSISFLWIAYQRGNNRWHPLISSISGLIVGLVLGLAPAWRSFNTGVTWLLGNFLNNSRYQSGSSGIISNIAILNSLNEIRTFLLPVVLMLLLTFALLLIRPIPKRASEHRYDLVLRFGLLLHIVAIFFLTLKAYWDVYTMGYLPPLALALCYLITQPRRFYRLIASVAGLLVLAATPLLFSSSLALYNEQAALRRTDAADFEALITDFSQRTAVPKSEISIAWTYGPPTNCSTLNLAYDYYRRPMLAHMDHVNDGNMAADIERVCPNQQSLTYAESHDILLIYAQIQPLYGNVIGTYSPFYLEQRGNAVLICKQSNPRCQAAYGVP